MPRMLSMDTDGSGMISANEFIDYFLDHAKNTLSLKKMISPTGFLASGKFKRASLIDRILFGIQQIDEDVMDEEER